MIKAPTKAADLPIDLRLVVRTVQAAFATALYREVVGHSTIVFIGSFNLTTAEPVLALAIVACVTLALSRPVRSDLQSFLLLAISGSTTIGLIRGIFDRPYDAIVSLRATGVLTAFLFMSCYLPKQEFLWRKIIEFTIFVALLTAGLLYIRMVVGAGFLLQTHFTDVTDINDGGRALSSQGALLIGVGATFALREAIKPRQISSPWVRAKFLVLVVALLSSHQGTAVIASMAALLIVLGFSSGTASALRMLFVLGVGLSALLVIFILPAMLSADSFELLLPQALTGDVAQRAANLATREYVWKGLLADLPHWSLFDQLFGLPSGEKPTIIVPLWGGVEWENSLHSMYYGLIPTIGLIGVTAYIVLLCWIMLRSAISLLLKRQRGVENNVLALALALMCALFSYGYDLRGEAGVILMCAAQVRSKKAASSERIRWDERPQASLSVGKLI